MHVEILPRIADVDAATWDTLVGEGCPFFEHGFLSAMEDAGCVGGDSGWTPRHLVLYDGAAPVAAATAYRKTHSQGEFIFDWGWAEAAQRAGIPYFPKLIIAAPFSPVGGVRLHVGDACPPERALALRAALIGAMGELARSERLTGIHGLFLDPAETAAFEVQGFAVRHTVQFHWRREGARTFDDFLARFDSKRRHQIRRERRVVREAGVTTRVLTGDDLLPGMAPLLHTLYVNTVDKFAWGRRYLNPQFFELLLSRWRHRLLVILAEREGRIVGGTINGAKGGVLYGRYWGALPGLGVEVDIPFLHFEVCSYAGIEVCIERGFERFEAGAGGGEHKSGRGFEPTIVRSAHRLAHGGLQRAVDAFVASERQALAEELAEMGTGRKDEKTRKAGD